MLPFVDLSGNPENEYFADGLTEELIGTLAALPELRVVARTSAFQFKKRGEDIRKIGKKLGVQSALEGSVRKEGQKIRVVAQLINVSDGFHLWSNRYDRDLIGVFEMQEEITCAIVDALKIRLTPAGKSRLHSPERPSPQAYELYLKSRYFWHRVTSADIRKSIEYIEQAIVLEPNYAIAYAALADAYIAVVYSGIRTSLGNCAEGQTGCEKGTGT